MCFLFTISPVLVPQSDNRKQTYIFKLNLSLLLIMSLSELLLPILRPLTTFISFGYLYHFFNLSEGHFSSPLFFVASSFTLGTSLSYSLTYLRLAFLGLTKKELRSIDFEASDSEK